jgi:hypothetical protein
VLQAEDKISYLALGAHQSFHQFLKGAFKQKIPAGWLGFCFLFLIFYIPLLSPAKNLRPKTTNKMVEIKIWILTRFFI